MSGIVNVEEVDELSDWLVGRGGFKGYTGVAVSRVRRFRPPPSSGWTQAGTS